MVTDGATGPACQRSGSLARLVTEIDSSLPCFRMQPGLRGLIKPQALSEPSNYAFTVLGSEAKVSGPLYAVPSLAHILRNFLLLLFTVCRELFHHLGKAERAGECWLPLCSLCS